MMKMSEFLCMSNFKANAIWNFWYRWGKPWCAGGYLGSKECVTVWVLSLDSLLWKNHIENKAWKMRFFQGNFRWASKWWKWANFCACQTSRPMPLGTFGIVEATHDVLEVALGLKSVSQFGFCHWIRCFEKIISKTKRKKLSFFQGELRWAW